VNIHTSSELKSCYVAVVLIMILSGATVTTHAIVDHQRPSQVRFKKLSYLPNGDYLKMAVLGYRQVAADLIWLEVLQHFGVREQDTEGYLWAYHAVDVLTDLDPHFIFSYQAAGTVLAIWAKRAQESVAILEKGMRHNPQEWILPFLLGYDYYFELHDPETAGRYFRLAAMLPGSPNYLADLATKMSVESGNPEVALEFLQRLYDKAEAERTREGLAQRMKEVIAERNIRVLEDVVRQYHQHFGKRPTKLDDLTASGMIQQIPSEPLGGAYQLNPSDGTVSSSGLRERLRVHRR
jgi:hypothetical protein